MKRTIKWICLFLCVVLVFGMFAKPALATYASELTNSVIKEKEQEIDKAKQEKTVTEQSDRREEAEGTAGEVQAGSDSLRTGAGCGSDGNSGED